MRTTYLIIFGVFNTRFWRFSKRRFRAKNWLVLHCLCPALCTYLSLISLLRSELLAQVNPLPNLLLVHAVRILRYEFVILRRQSDAHCRWHDDVRTPRDELCGQVVQHMVVANIHNSVVGLNGKNQVVFVVWVELYLLDFLKIVTGLQLIGIMHRRNVLILQLLLLCCFGLQILVNSPYALLSCPLCLWIRIVFHGLFPRV